jgi:two-component system sensor histidine kinase KdpD
MPEARTSAPSSSIWLIFAMALTGGLGWAGVIWPEFGTANLALLLLLPVVVASAGSGRRAGIAVAFLAGCVFNFVALEPRLTFDITKASDLLTLGVYALVALVTASVAARLAEAGARARQEAADSAAFFRLTQQLLNAGTPGQVCQVTASAVETLCGYPCEVVESVDALSFVDASDEAAARWALAHREMAGLGVMRFPSAAALYVPSHAGRRALLARLAGPAHQSVRLELLRSFFDEAADALDRIELAERIETDHRRAEADTMRKAIFASISHDLRTPMTSLRAGLEGLTSDDPDRVVQARTDALRLERTLENLLELARLQASDTLPEVAAMDLTDTIASAIDAMPTATRDRIRVEFAGDTPIVQSDAVMLHHIVINLLENAAKYSPQDAPILISAHKADGGARMAIVDGGPGIGEDAADLFALFRRGTNADTAPGSGIGLSVVDAFARALGHRISVTNRPGGQGAEFAIEFADRKQAS